MYHSVQMPHGRCPTHRTPSAAGRSAAWPRTPAGSARRCATSWGWRGVRLRAAGRGARAASGRVAASAAGSGRSAAPGRHGRRAPPGGGAARGRLCGRRANPADPSSSRGGRSAGRGVSRNASTRSSSLPRVSDAVPGDPGGDRMRFHGGQHAPVAGEERHRDARRSHGPRRRPLESFLSPNERQITSPGSR